MIALNEIKNNPKYYEEKFKAMGKNVNLNPILNLWEKLSNLQQSLEQTKSNLSKLSSTVTEIRNKKQSTKNVEYELDSLNKNMQKIQKQYNKVQKKINRLLKRVPNPATNENIDDIPLKTSKKSIEKFELIEFIKKSILHTSNQKGKLKTYLKQTKDQIKTENELPQAAIFDNEILVSTSFEKYKNIKENLINFTNQNSLTNIQVSIKKLKYYENEEYRAVLNKNLKIQISFISEYLAREFGLKYFDSQKGMTKFVNQIIIKKDD